MNTSIKTYITIPIQVEFRKMKVNDFEDNSQNWTYQSPIINNSIFAYSPNLSMVMRTGNNRPEIVGNRSHETTRND